MESARDLSRRYRLNQIVEALSVEPLTAREIATRFDANYNTCRKDLTDLMADYRIHPTSVIKGGAIQYAAGSPNRMPEIHHPRLGKDLPILDWVKDWLDKGMPSSVVVNPVDDQMPSMVALLALIFNARNAPDKSSVSKHRIALLQRVTKNREILQNYISVCQQLCNSSLLIEEKLTQFVESTEIPSDEIETTVRRYYSMLNTESNTTEVNDE